MPTVTIDNKEISVKPGTTIMEAARLLGVEIPHFCYHPKLSMAGSCRMCMVEVEKMPRPVPACAMPINDGMVVRTASDAALKARRVVMEFLLINHPMDCPVCDQGGECSLQDFSMKYGPDRSRFREVKRQVKDKDIGPIIETVMNRCIHCTRCIRFSEEVAGVEEMGAVFRGDHMTVGTYVEKTLSSELAGNLAQLCPVGALNLKPFHYQARGWELKRANGICNHCSVGCQVRRDHLNNAVKRVMALPCDAINEVWICDRGRFAHDGLSRERVLNPQIRRDRTGLGPVSWQEALDKTAEIIKGVRPEEVAGLADPRLAAGEELFAFQDFLRHAVGTPHIDHRLRQNDFSGDDTPLTRADLLMNTPLAELEKADVVVIIGGDPRYETPILNLRLRKAARAGAKVFSINPRQLNSTIPGLVDVVTRPGGEPALLKQVLAAVKGAGGSPLAEALRQAQRPVLLLGEYAINHPRAESIRRLAVSILEAVNGIRADWNGFNRVSSRAAAPAAQDLGVVPHRGPGYRRVEKQGYNATRILEAAARGEIKVLFLLGADPLTDGADAALARQALEKARVIYLGAYQTETASHADVVLAGVTASEKEATFTNAEGRVQHSSAAVAPPENAHEDWRILRALSDRFAQPLAYNTTAALRKVMAAADHRYNLDELEENELARPCDHKPVTTGLAPADDGLPGNGLVLVLESSLYHDDPITRRSTTLQQLDPGPRVRLNPAEADGLKIRDGQKVRVIQGERKIETIANLDGRVPAGVVVGEYGYDKALVQELWLAGRGFPTVSIVGL